MAVLCALAVGCGGSDGNGAGEAETDGLGTSDGSGSAEASPFLVEAVPPGFALETAGQGTGTQEWGSDSVGTDQPLTVLAPPVAGADSDEAVVVQVTGYEGYQGGLSQASGGYGSEEADEFEVDGRPAIYSPAGAEGFGEPAEWADLVVVRGDDLAVHISAADADRDTLVDIAQRVEPDDDHARAPHVPDPPDGLEVVGSVDAGVIVSLSAYVTADSDSVPGLESAYGAGWLSGPAGPPPETEAGPPMTEVGPGPTVVDAGPGGAAAEAAPAAFPTPLTLVAYPGHAADLDALGALVHVDHREPTVTPLTVGGRPGVVVETSSPGEEHSPPFASRTVLTHAPWGDLLMAGSGGLPDAVPSAEQLAEMLASARQASAEEWEAFAVEAAGGPGLHPDDGAVEIDRGTVTGTDGDVEWLLQARPGALDACLKLSTRERACGIGMSSGDGTSLGTGGRRPDEDSGVPGFVFAALDTAGVRLRVTTPEATGEGTLHAIPESALHGGVVFVEGLGDFPGFTCPGEPELPEHMTPVTLEVLDAAGTVVGCVDLGGGIRPT
jgi:hypothetical protein